MSWRWLVYLALAGAVGCAAETVADDDPADGRDDTFLVDGKADAFGVAEGSPLAEGVLRLVNSASMSELDDDVPLDWRAANGIVTHRDGPDGQLGTADDDPFDTLVELDATPWVGPVAFGALAAYAEDNGYVNHATGGHELLPAPTDGRSDHVSVTLPDGRILVVGGMGYDGVLASAEIFDPTTETWSATGSMATPRHDAAGVVLNDGRVLIAGGDAGYWNHSWRARRAAEIWDPATGGWSAAADMHNRRMLHTATLLGDGRVLVVGGQNSSNSYTEPSAEVYDPATDTWTEVGRMPVAVQEHTATLAPDGSVVIVGGYNRGDRDRTRTIVRFDPTTDALEVAGRLHTARAEHTATIVGNELLVAGGTGNRHQYLASAELIDLTTFETEVVEPMILARAGHAATTLPSGAVALLGGRDERSWRGVVEVDVFDPTTRTWSLGAPVPAGRIEFTAQEVADGTLMIGGATGVSDHPPTVLYREGATTQVQVPNIDTTSDWELLENFGEEVDCGADEVEYHEALGQLICFPGRETENVPIGTYAWTGAGWEEIVAPLDSPVPPRAHHTMTYDSARGKIVLFGGQKRWGYDLDDVWEFDGTTWEKATPATAAVPPRQRSARIVYDATRQRSVLLPGTMEGTRSLDLYAWDGTQWTVVPQSNDGAHFEGRHEFGAVYDPVRDRVVMFGGRTTSQDGIANYEFDGTSWERIPDGLPTHGADLDGAYDPVAGKIYAIGVTEVRSSLAQAYGVFEYDGGWTEVPTEHSLYYRERDRALVFDGSTGHLTLTGNPRQSSGRRWAPRASLLQLRAHLPPNQRPRLDYIGRRMAYVNETLTVDLTVTDADGHDVALSATGVPNGADFDPDTGVFTWTPQPGDGGHYVVDFTASDGALTDSKELEIEVQGLITYPMLPTGEIDMSGGVSMSGSVSERNRWGWTSHGATFRVSCDFTGTNPGRVTYTCDIVKTSEWPYDYTVTTSGELRPDGKLGGVATGAWGEVRALQWDDYELVVNGIDARWQDEDWTATGEYRGYLTANTP